MKKILLSLMIIALASSAAIGATRAYFSDTETATDNTFAAGTLDLRTNNTDGVTAAFTVSNLHPGSWDAGNQVVLKNAGTLKGHAWLEIVNVRNNENGCTDPENKAGDTTCNPDQGELGNYAKPIFSRNVAPWGYFGSTTTPINSEIGTHIDLQDLNPDETLPIFMYSAWTPTSTDNLAQGDSVDFDVVFHLDQLP